MRVRQERLRLAVVQELRHEFLKHLALPQTLSVLGEGRRIPDGGKANKPAIRKIVVEPLDRLPLRADRVKHLRRQGARQVLGRDRWTPRGRIRLSEARAEFLENRAHQLPDSSQGTPRRHPRLRRNAGQRSALVPELAAHKNSFRFATKVIHQRFAKSRVFRQTASKGCKARSCKCQRPTELR